jgi:hypothetical protein
MTNNSCPVDPNEGDLCVEGVEPEDSDLLGEEGVDVDPTIYKFGSDYARNCEGSVE